MPEFLVGFTYHEPDSYALWQQGAIEDFETSTGLWVSAGTPEEAISLAQRVAEELHRHTNGDPSADWSGVGHHCWVVESPAESCWGHCLNFFQRVRVGEMPSLDRMGTAAFVRWQEQMRF